MAILTEQMMLFSGSTYRVYRSSWSLGSPGLAEDSWW